MRSAAHVLASGAFANRMSPVGIPLLRPPLWFLYEFSDRISAPVPTAARTEAAMVEYVPTQIVCEDFRTTFARDWGQVVQATETHRCYGPPSLARCNDAVLDGRYVASSKSATSNGSIERRLPPTDWAARRTIVLADSSL
jgi:hypothetical protein